MSALTKKLRAGTAPRPPHHPRAAVSLARDIADEGTAGPDGAFAAHLLAKEVEQRHHGGGIRSLGASSALSAAWQDARLSRRPEATLGRRPVAPPAGCRGRPGPRPGGDSWPTLQGIGKQAAKLPSPSAIPAYRGGSKGSLLWRLNFSPCLFTSRFAGWPDWAGGRGDGRRPEAASPGPPAVP